MSESCEMPNTLECRATIIDGTSQAVLVLSRDDGFAFPHVLISPQARPAEQLCKAIRREWGLSVLILDFLPTNSDSQYSVIAELLSEMKASPEFTSLQLDQFPLYLLSQRDLASLTQTLNGGVSSSFSRLGWINEAVAWLEKETGHRLSSRDCIEQLNAGGAFALLRLPMGDGRKYWLKATGEPNAHEFAVTLCLSQYFPDALPPLIAAKEDWNAWLTEEVGARLPDQPTAEPLVRAAQAFASLQLRTTTRIDALLNSGVFDLRIATLTQSIDSIMEYLACAMTRQQTRRVAPLSLGQLRELTAVLRDTCECMTSLSIPDTLIHNDLSPGNVLDDGSRCVFTDRSEEAISNPFLSCERLCQLNPAQSENVHAVYRDVWSQHLHVAAIDKAFVLMPLLAIYAYLYGRGDWMRNKSCHPRFESYARGLARHMYRAAKNPLLVETLCH
jgi:hypothetical protein